MSVTINILPTMSTAISLPLTPLQQQWTTMYRTTLPTLARTKHSRSSNAQWPVQLDHCFARIILDNAVGVTKPWTEVIKAPATRNMNEVQLGKAIALGERIADGREDLWALDAKSLELRGKVKGGGVKRKREAKHTSGEEAKDDDEQKENESPDLDPERTSPDRLPKKKTRKGEVGDIWAAFSAVKAKDTSPAEVDEREAESIASIRQIIASDPSLKPFRKLVLTLLTQVPRGRYTTYQALSDAAMRFAPAATAKPPAAVEKEGKRGCARAIGSVMRNNPFAPTAPCHRVLASDGKIGGFKGDWGEEGRFVSEKRRLLKEEGVKFDGKGKVVGEPFRGFFKPW